MANETTTTSANDVLFANWVGDMILDEIRPYNVMRPFFRSEGGQKSNSFNFPIQDDPGAATASTEGTGLSNTQLTTNVATATVGTVGQMATVTDELNAVSVIDAYAQFGAVLGRSVAEKYETDFTALVDDFSNTGGPGTGVDLTVAAYLAQLSALEQRDAVGELVTVLHPVQVGDLRSAMITSTGAYFGNDSAKIGGIDAHDLAGYAGDPFGVPIFQTSLVPTANVGADRAGAVFVAGVALGLYEIWGTRIETERDASLPGTEIVATARYGVVEIRDTWGQTIISDA